MFELNPKIIINMSKGCYDCIHIIIHNEYILCKIKDEKLETTLDGPKCNNFEYENRWSKHIVKINKINYKSIDKLK